ncbi:MAG: thiamine phosphate synthase [Pseudomonadota bacterium]|nr:thiamine phosphate synthase [Pseudomonadota bacterium]
MIEPFPLEGIYAITPSYKKNKLAYLEKIEETVRAGVAALQIREKNYLETSDFIRLLKSVRDLCSDYKIKLIINDNVRVAKQLNCGVHLGKDDLSLEQARREMGEKAIIGVSCYNSALNAKKFAELGASYVALGCFFPSITKPDAIKCSSVELQKLNGKLKVPIVAIGGITNTNAKTIIQYGADLVAVSSYIYDSDSPYEKIKCLQSVVSEAK